MFPTTEKSHFIAENRSFYAMIQPLSVYSKFGIGKYIFTCTSRDVLKVFPSCIKHHAMQA
jgi:hypothetical protein